MLAVLETSVAAGPQELNSPDAGPRKAAIDIAASFASANPSDAVSVKVPGIGVLAYSRKPLNLQTPRTFGAVDDMFCVFEGFLHNVGQLRQQYGLGKNASEVNIVIEAYRTLRDRGPYPADHVVRDLSGKFAFVLLDSATKAVFTAGDADGSVPFFWGTAADGHLVLSDDANIMKAGCGKSFAPFPKGCFFSTSGGLQSFLHPFNKLTPMPRVDSQGHVCGANFKVDESSKKTAGMPRVGSEANWANNF